MRIMADENLYEPIISYLKNLGHDVFSIREAGLCGISDDEVYLLACKENRVIITMDKDFLRMFRFPPYRCGGIIVVKIYKQTIEKTLEIFKRCFNTLKIENIENRLIIISTEGIRLKGIRR